MADPADLTALEAGAAIAAGTLTSEALVRACLDRIAARESAVGAWIYIDPDAALAEARARDREKPRGPLHGVPVGVKDVVETHDMPSAYGSPIYAGHRPAADAACVALLRAAGMVVLGKAVTTEFAVRHPGRTRNPHDPTRTPGGSSSGSAAAVGAGMVPLAIGTQTAGSVIRPASYCGVVGYKPTWGSIPRAGVKLLAESLDTIGMMARTVADAGAFAQAMAGWPVTPLPGRAAAPKLGFCKSPAWPVADSASRAAVEEAAARARKAGATVVEVTLPAPFDDALDAHGTIMAVEACRLLAHEFNNHLDRISPALKDYILPLNQAASYERYGWAKGIQAACRAAIAETFKGVDALLTPAAPGEAPVGLGSTGDASLNRIWTMTGVPCVTVPGLKGPNGMPVGAQIVGPFGGDAETLAVADWLHRVLAG